MVDLLGFSFLKKNELDDLKLNLSKLEGQVTELRTQADFGVLFRHKSLMQRRYPLSIPDMYARVEQSNLMQTIISAIQNEAFRNGWEFKPKFQKQCTECKSEFDFEAKACDNCGNETLRDPDSDQKKGLEKYLNGHVNKNGHTFVQLLKQLEYDHNVVDNSFLQLNKQYLTKNGKIMFGEIVEMVRIHPALVELVTDDKGRLGFDEEGNAARFCVDHRDELITTDETACKKCGLELFTASYRVGGIWTSSAQNEARYYTDAEIKHTSEFHPTLGLAYPIFLSVWRNVDMLMNMEDYNRRSFGEERTPKKLLFVNTTNQSMLKRIMDWANEQLGRGNPNQVVPFGVETPDGKGVPATVVSLVDEHLLENEIELVQDTRRNTGSVYGVSPVFLSDVSTSGGLNNEGIQVTVTNRATVRSQSPFNTGIFPWLLAQWGVTDWVLELNPSEEQDEAADVQLDILKSQHAQIMLAMGFEVKLDEQGEFTFSGEPNPNILSPVKPVEPPTLSPPKPFMPEGTPAESV